MRISRRIRRVDITVTLVLVGVNAGEMVILGRCREMVLIEFFLDDGKSLPPRRFMSVTIRRRKGTSHDSALLQQSVVVVLLK